MQPTTAVTEPRPDLAAAAVTLIPYLLFPAVSVMTLAAIGAAAPDLRAAMQLTAPQISLLAGTYLLANGLAQPFAGQLVDRFGSARCVIAALPLASVGALVFATSHGETQALVGYAWMGACCSVSGPSYGALSARLVGKRLFPVAAGLLAFMMGIAGAIGTSVGNALPDADGWRYSLAALPTLAIPLGVTVWMMRGRTANAAAAAAASTSAPATDEARLPPWKLLGIREVRICCFTAFMLGGTLWSFSGLWNEFVARNLWNLPAEERGIAMGAFQVAAAVGAPLVALLAARLGPVVPLRAATALTFIAMVAWVLTPVHFGTAVAAAILALMGLGASAVPVAMGAAVRKVPAGSTGACVGLVQASSMIGGFALIWLPSFLTLVPDFGPQARGHVGGAVIAALVAVVHVLTWRLRRE